MNQLFSIGQPVTPVSRKWYLIHEGAFGGLIPPKFGEIYHVGGYDENSPIHGITYMWLEEFGNKMMYDQEGFSPVMGDGELELALAEVDEMVMV